MRLKYANEVKEQTDTVGTGDYVLRPLSGHRTFLSGVGINTLCKYLVSNGHQWEIAEGSLIATGADTLSRATIRDSSDGGRAINWTAGRKDVTLEYEELTDTQLDLFDHIEYKPDTGRIVSNVPMQTTLDSFFLGNMHEISSGGYMTFRTNLDTGTSFYSAGGGIKDHTNPANRDMSGLLPPSARVYGAYMEVESNGAVTSNDVNYEFNAPLAYSASVYGVKVKVTDAVVPTDTIHYHLYMGTDDTGILAYDQRITGRTVAAGGLLEWWFSHPVDLLEAAGSIHVVLLKNKQVMSVKTGTLVPTEPWVVGMLRTLEDKSLSFQGEETLTLDRILIGSDGNAIADNNGNLMLSGE